MTIDRQTAIVALRDALAELYPEEQDARVVVADAGVDAKQITFSTRASTNWHNILTETVRQNRLDVLFQVVHSTYGDNPTFQAAYAQYSQWTEQASHSYPPPSLAVDSDSFATITSEAGKSAAQLRQQDRQTRPDSPEPRNPVGRIQAEVARIGKPETSPTQRNQSAFTEEGRPQRAGNLRRVARNGIISLIILLALLGIGVIYFVYQTIRNPQSMGSWLMGGAQFAPIPSDSSCPQRFGAGWLQKPVEFYGAYVPKTPLTINQLLVPANNPLWVEWQGNNGKLVGIWIHVSGTETALGPFNPQTTGGPGQWMRFADLPFYGCVDSQNRVLVAFEP